MKLHTSFSLLILSCTVLAAAPVAADELRQPIQFEFPVLSETPVGQVLAIPGTELRASPGEPLLPVANLTFLLPHGHMLQEIRLEDEKVEPLDGVYPIAPGQLPYPLIRGIEPRPTDPDPAVYGQDHLLPGTWVSAGPIQFQHGYALLPVLVHPLQYKPLSGMVDRLVSATVVLVTKPGGTVSDLYRASPADETVVKTRVVDPEVLGTYPAKPVRSPVRLDPGTYTYLIVTPEAFVDLGGEDSLEALRDYRENNGMPANIVTLEWIQANYDGNRPDGGQDDATRVRDFLIDAHLEWTTSYVLLVGDADSADVGGESGDDLMPVRKFFVDPNHPDAAGDYIPSDLWYGCLDGSFDYDADGVYGERQDGPDGGEVDLMAELYVGRAPADSEQEVRNFVGKTLAYEQAAGAWLQKVLMVGELLWDDPYDVWAADCMDEIKEGTDSGGYTTLGFDSHAFFVTDTLYDRDMGGANSWGGSTLVPILNDGPHVVNHLGHSDVTYNMRLMNNDVDGLINTRPFLLYSQGCLPGSFDNESAADAGNYVYSSDCIAEHFVMNPHGAFAAVVNARYGWGSFMTNSPSQMFNRQFWDAFFAEGMTTIGQALADSKEDNAWGFSDPYIRWVGFESNLLGDPAVVFKKSLNTDEPLLGIYPPGLRFVGLVGDPAPLPTVLGVRNDGVDTLSFTVDADQDWVAFSPASGDAPTDVEVSVDPTGLAAGTHTALISFSSPEAANSPVEIEMDFTLVEVSEMAVPHMDQAPTLDGVITAGEYDQAVTLPIDPQGGPDVTLYMAVAGETLYIAVEDLIDRAEDGFDRLTIMFDRDLDGLWPEVSAEEGLYTLVGMQGGMTLFIPVFNPGGGYQMDMNGIEMNPRGFIGEMGFPDNHRVYEVALDLNDSYLDVGPVGTFGMFLSVTNSVQMGTGTDTGFWPKDIPSIDDQRFFGRVEMVPEGTWLYSDPRDLAFEAVPGRPAPDGIELSVFDLQGGVLDYTATSSQPWLVIDHDSGQTPDTLAVSVDHTGLAIDSYQAEIVLESAGAENVQHRVPVTLDVLPAPGFLTVEPASFDLAASDQVADPVMTLLIRNTGGRPLNWTVTSDQTWLKAQWERGLMQPGASRAVNLTAELFWIDKGTHHANVLVEAADAEGSPVNVPITLEVVGEAEVPPVEVFQLEAFQGEIHLDWVKPDDPIVTGVLIRRGVNSAPVDPESGDVVYDGREENWIDSGLGDGVSYCYSFFAHDAAGRFAAPASGCQVPGANQPPPVPDPLAPTDMSLLDAVPQLEASPVVDPQGNAVSYTFQVLEENGAEPIESGQGELSGDRVVWTPAANLEPGVTYQWQVEAVDDQGAHSGFSPAWNFALAGGDEGSGCGCSHHGSSSSWLLFFLLGLVLLRRK